MKFEFRNSRHSIRRGEAAFTMIEIAFSLAIVAFALVAIMGVLPTGMTVQKDNREDTLINNDAYFWAEAMRSGSRGIDDLTNYVEEITIDSKNTKKTWVAAWSSSTVPDKLTTGEQIIALLTRPKYTSENNEIITNIVTARVRAINGPALDMRNPRTNEVAFRYQLEPEVTPVYAAPVYTKGANLDQKYQYWTDAYLTRDYPTHLALATNLHNLRLTLRWPVFEQGTSWGVGRNKRTVRSVATGRVTPTAQDRLEGRELIEGRTNSMPHPNNYQYVSIEDLPK
jgi:type II secretory pathway pseudopilin PulG